MAVVKMQKLNLCAMQNSRSRILELLQRKGIVQITSSGEEEDDFRRTDTEEIRTRLERRAGEAQDALSVLDAYVPGKEGLFASLEGKKELSRSEYKRLEEREEEIYQSALEILKKQKALEECRARKLRLMTERETLVPWMGLDVPAGRKGTRYTDLLTGTLPGQYSREQILLDLAASLPQADAFEVEVLSSDTSQTCLAVLCLKTETEPLEEALRKMGFARSSFSFCQTPAAYAGELEKQAKETEGQERKILEELSALAERRDDLRFLFDYNTVQAEKYKVLGQLLLSEHVFFLSGYVPEKKAQGLAKELESSFLCAVEIQDVPKEEAPVLLKNNRFSGPAESVVASYGMPGKDDADPTSVMAIFYYFFFGMMLSDAGYGLVMVIGCLIALKKFPRMAKGMKDMLTMFLYCGISTVIWGILFGGYFGDVIPIAAETFFHREITVPALWFAPLDDPMKLLIFSFLFGIIHLFAGLGIKGYQLVRDKQYLDCLFDVGFWYMLLLGLIFMLLPSQMFASMSGMTFVFPGWVGTLAKVLAIAGAAGILVMSGRGRKNIGIRLALGAYDLYGITSWLSDILSYSRLLALGVATGVIASVINTMAAMVGGGIIGAIVFAVIFLAGHTLNLAINLLGAYVHTNRLQYVEFFGKFYDGSGEAFHPFSTESSKYYDVKEEN